MKYRQCHRLLMLLLMLVPSAVQAKSSVWEVSKNGQTLYLGGTVHLLSESDYPLPESFHNAYKKADDIVLETNINATKDSSFQLKSLQVMTFQDHRSLSTVLDRETYNAFSELLSSKGIPIAVFEKFTPAGASLALAAIEMQQLGMKEALGVEETFLKQANADKKTAHYLETVDEQLGFIDSMNRLEPNKLVQSSIKEMANFENQMDGLLESWRNGDLESLEAIGIEKMQTEFPSLYQVLLVSRNNAWMRDIETFIESPEIEFILVGALHMAGEHGLIAQLKASGYELRQLD